MLSFLFASKKALPPLKAKKPAVCWGSKIDFLHPPQTTHHRFRFPPPPPPKSAKRNTHFSHDFISYAGSEPACATPHAYTGWISCETVALVALMHAGGGGWFLVVRSAFFIHPLFPFHLEFLSEWRAELENASSQAIRGIRSLGWDG